MPLTRQRGEGNAGAADTAKPMYSAVATPPAPAADAPLLAESSGPCSEAVERLAAPKQQRITVHCRRVPPRKVKEAPASAGGEQGAAAAAHTRPRSAPPAGKVGVAVLMQQRIPSAALGLLRASQQEAMAACAATCGFAASMGPALAAMQTALDVAVPIVAVYSSVGEPRLCPEDFVGTSPCPLGLRLGFSCDTSARSIRLDTATPVGFRVTLPAGTVAMNTLHSFFQAGGAMRGLTNGRAGVSRADGETVVVCLPGDALRGMGPVGKGLRKCARAAAKTALAVTSRLSAATAPRYRTVVLRCEGAAQSEPSTTLRLPEASVLGGDVAEVLQRCNAALGRRRDAEAVQRVLTMDGAELRGDARIQHGASLLYSFCAAAAAAAPPAAVTPSKRRVLQVRG